MNLGTDEFEQPVKRTKKIKIRKVSLRKVKHVKRHQFSFLDSDMVNRDNLSEITSPPTTARAEIYEETHDKNEINLEPPKQTDIIESSSDE